jgi:uncharacterized protein (TIGR02246 family)
MQRFVTRVSLALVLLFAAGAGAQERKTNSEEPKELGQLSKDFVEAFNKGDAEALAKFWTEDADHVDSVGRVRKGRKAILEAYRKLFAANKGAKLTIIPLSRRQLTPDCVVSDGLTEVIPASGPPSTGRYTAISVKKGGRWLLASVRETLATPPSNFEFLEDLEFLVGDWTDDNGKAGESAHVSYSWEHNQNFLVVHFTATLKDVPVSGGVQWIGWDAAAKRIRAWTFHSSGGFSEGVWSKDGNKFKVKIHSTLRDGGKTSSTNIITKVDDDHFTWQSTERKVDGKEVPDTKVIKFKRVK